MKKRLMELKKLFQNHGIRWKRWRGLVTVLAMVVVFVTTYALILPAITLEKDQGKPEQGVYLDPMERGSTAALNNEEKTNQPDESTSPGAKNHANQEENTDETAFSVGSHDDRSDTKGKNVDDGSGQGQKTAYANGIYTGKGDGYTVSVDLKEEMQIPADVVISVEEIRENEKSMEMAADYHACMTAAKKTASKEGRGEITSVRFFKFALLSGDREVRTSQDIDMLILPDQKDKVRNGEQAYVLAFRGSSAFMVEDVRTQMIGYRVSAYRFIYPSIAGNNSWGLLGLAVTEPEAWDEGEETASTEAEVSTESEAATEAAATTEANGSTEEPAAVEAATETEAAGTETPGTKGTVEGSRPAGTLEYNDDGCKVVMTYDEKAGIPEGAVLQVTEIQKDSKEYEKYLKEASETLEIGKKANPRARFFDIKIMDGDKEIEPDSPVSVQISYDQPLKVNEGDKVDALHFGKKKTEVIEDVAVKTNRRDDVEGVTFEADSFSVYGIVTYTVDFQYEANGKMYEFSIPGGGFVSLEHLVEALGISSADSFKDSEDSRKNTVKEQSADNNTDKEEGASEKKEAGFDVGENTAYQKTMALNKTEISEDTKAFMTNVADVEFSDSRALWIGQVTEDTLVRELKETNNLEIKYSDNLTVKEIAGMNAQVVKAGDWALISVYPFTEEELTIVMKDGERFTIQLKGNAPAFKQRVQYTAADGNLIVTASASEGALPEGTKLQISEISPFDENRKETAEKEAQVYSDALTAVAGYLKEKGSSRTGAKVCDISFIGPDDKEIEPDSSVDVSISFRDSAALETDKDGAENGVAHISNVGKAEQMKADIDTEENGQIREAVFSSDTFSVYVVFNGSPDTQSSEPVYLKDGWIRIGGDYRKPDPNVLPDGTHGSNDENGWKNYIRINLHTLKPNRPQNSMNPNDYNQTSTFAWAAGYDEFLIEDYQFNGEVVFTQFHPADRDIMDPQAGMQETYPARTAFHNWSEDSWEVFENVLNVYVNTTEPAQTANKTDYVIRYHHVDGTYHEETGFLTSSSGSKNFSYGDKMKPGEVYSGMTISAGNVALSNVNINSGSGRINYESTTPVVKVNIYYKEDVQGVTGGTVNGTPRYDTSGSGAGKIYDTSRTGLHTDKTAAITSNASLQDGRTFDLTLESWNVGGELANVGMVLDASGSMVWTSDEPVVIRYSDNEWKSILGESYYNSVKGDQKILTPEAVNKILNTANCDYSKLSYNGYKYYVKDPANSVKEYAPLGYYKGGRMKDREGKVASDDYFMTIEIREPTNLPWESPSYRYYDATAGWYYINSTNGAWYKNHGTAKAYCNYSYQDAWSVDGYNRQTSAKFYIDSTGKLHCRYYRVVSGTAQEWSSDVYMKANDSDTKSEVLQNSIARFVSILNAMSPESEVGMTRFSRNNSNNDGFTADQLPLLNWTNDSAMITAALNQRYGGGTSTGTDPQNGLSVYNYGFTGNTSTYSGMEAYLRYLTNNNQSNYTPTTGNNLASKYLIIFTDGKDTDIGNNPTSGTAVNYARALKNAGYTIFTVLMQSAGMSSDDVAKSTTFLKTLAGTSTQSGDNYFYSSMYNDPEALVENFRQIALKIAQPLNGYMIRDYIDPRFDLIDEDGTVMTQLNAQGAWSPRSITTADGKSAILKYDTDKKMFYLEIENQVIPSSPQNAAQVTVNSTLITVRAKADFPGGEDMLTNGNENGQNSVFKPTNESTIHENLPTPADQSAAQKDFPKTTANPATLNVTLSNYEDTIFLGETISPASLYDSVQTKRDQAVDYRSVYLNYLTRAGQKFQNDPTYYVTLLKYGTVPEGAANTDPGKDKNGNSITDFVFEVDSNGVTTLTLPYYYLENPGDVTSYAGGNLHQADKVGKVTYSWKALTTGNHTLTDNNALKDYTSTTLDTVRYQLAIDYQADPYDLTKIINSNGRIVNDSIANNGSVRTLTLTNQRGTDKLIKDPVGVGSTPVAEQRTDTDTQGLAVIHVVAGKFKVIKRIEISDADWTNLVTKAGDNGLTFTFQLKKDGVNYGDPFTINTNTAEKTVNGNYIELSSDWIDNLPKGNYTVEETGQPEGFTYKSVAIAAVTADDADSSRTGGTPFAAPTTGTATWEIGSVDGGVPAATTYADTDFSAAKVKDANKEVDPDKSKVYLNAQIGKGVVLNEPPKTKDITLKKTDKDTGESIGGAKFALIKDSEYVDLEAFTITKLVSTEEDPVVETITIGSNPNVKVVTVPKGGIKIEALEDGSYILKEMAAPAGYVITNSGEEFIIENGELKDHTDPEAGINFKVENVPGAELPSAGGPGTTAFYLLGIMMTGLAGACLVMRKRRKAA